jgi:tRNA(fMet)-specific endonuclease VapC
MYLIDTNICVFAVKHHARVIYHFKAHSPDDFKISSVSIAEIWYGIEKSQQREKNLEIWRSFFAPFEIADFDQKAGEKYGAVRAQLESVGKMIGDHDCMIAATALVNDLVVITNNTKEFQRIKGLKVKDWTLA